MSEAAVVKAKASRAPAWVITFADLMSLLMCFFVLLLAFSEMDVLKFKQLAGSMREAFGVQREIKAKEIPKGTSVIAREFSPGRPEPTALNQVRQHTQDDLRRHLQTESKSGSENEAGGKDDSEQTKIIEVPVKAPEVDDSEIRQAFAREIEGGLIEVETNDQRIIIRIQEKGSFPSGSATLITRFEPVIARIGDVVKKTTGRVVIAGHTDNLPISTSRFRSNWELSAARSVTVLHHLAKVSGIEQERLLIEGHADTNPLAPNNTRENRARNRRVEIVIVKGADVATAELPVEPNVGIARPPG